MKQELGYSFYVPIACIFVAVACFSIRLDLIEKRYKSENRVSFNNEADLDLHVKDIRVVKGLSFDIPVKGNTTMGYCMEDEIIKDYIFPTSQDGIYVFIRELKIDAFALNSLACQQAILNTVNSFDYSNLVYEKVEFPDIFEGIVENFFLSDPDTLILLVGNSLSVEKDDDKITLSSYTNAMKSDVLEHYGAIVVWDDKEKKMLLLGKVLIL